MRLAGDQKTLKLTALSQSEGASWVRALRAAADEEAAAAHADADADAVEPLPSVDDDDSGDDAPVEPHSPDVVYAAVSTLTSR